MCTVYYFKMFYVYVLVNFVGYIKNYYLNFFNWYNHACNSYVL